jgi:GDP/UDP-N,N'-diacetylbacillosamine 2-epimerase (hydrolysing)
MKIGILTSSRADFGIYLPLLKEMQRQSWIDARIIAFGTHLSRFHGYTLKQIEESGFKASYTVESMLLSDTPDSVSTAIGLTTLQFATFWKEHRADFDLVFALGDRYEMFAAVMAGVPSQIKFAHLHGGEKTLGAIDNVFRHCITQASSIHFTSTQQYADRVRQLLDQPEHIYWVGALSLDNLSEVKLLSVREFAEKWKIDLQKPTVLTTFHPETSNPTRNEHDAFQLVEAIEAMNGYQVLLTMPNIDTNGSIVREIFNTRLGQRPGVFLIENLGTQSYFTAMNHCRFLLGNTSSGIIEAASFAKYVINLGDRQKGRLYGDNVFTIDVSKENILAAVKRIESLPAPSAKNIYYNGGAAKAIVRIIESIFKE